MSSGTWTPQKRTLTDSDRPAKRRKTTWTSNRSIWNSPDDWDSLVSTSRLSTASVSLRRPRPYGLPTLVSCAIDVSARSFKWLWEIPTPGGFAGQTVLGEYWKDGWEWVPDHLKVLVREKVFEYWGEYITSEMLRETFAVPPMVYLPSNLLPVLSKADTLRSFSPEGLQKYTTLKVTYSTTTSDSAFAALIKEMPNLEEINLKGCPLVGVKTVDTLIKHCPHLRRINLKETGVTEDHVKRLLDRFSQQIEAFKVDLVLIQNVNDTLSSIPLPRLTHLCLPGDFLNARDALQIRRHAGQTSIPPPKPTPEGSVFDWPNISTCFPSLTHLYLPRSFIPDTRFGFRSNTLVKLVLGSDPPTPSDALICLLVDQLESLKKLELGYILPQGNGIGRGGMSDFQIIGGLLADCKLESFKLVCPETKNTAAKAEMMASASLLLEGIRGNWRKTLKHLSIDLNVGRLSIGELVPEEVDETCPVLETLRIPGLKMSNTEQLGPWIAGFGRLRELDLSASSINEEVMFGIIDHCQLLHRVDLTSCRGIKVPLRRDIFKAWDESRNPSAAEGPPAKRTRNAPRARR